VRAGDEASAVTTEPSALGRQRSLASRTAFFLVRRKGSPSYFVAFTAKLSPGLAKKGGATSYVPATIASSRHSDRLQRAVKDGDTIAIAFDGSQPIRFLGIDTPEKSYRAPFRLDSKGEPVFIQIGSHAAAWDAYLIAAVSEGGGGVALREALRRRLAQRIAPGVAENHASLAAGASKALLGHVSEDIADLRDGAVDEFGIFGAMAHEPFDGYGRVLAFLRPDQPDAAPAERRVDYNTRQLEAGAALPYFIWPNVEPFRKATLISEAVFSPSELRQRARASGALRRARNAVRAARQARAPGSVFDPRGPLRLAAFELRFLADKRVPDRAVVDLSAPDSEPILWPGDVYFVVPNPEDRLLVPKEYLPWFKLPQYGWRDPTAQELEAKIAAAPNVGPTGLPL
jgi:endonuclease YncB( thermonuclease family)